MSGDWVLAELSESMGSLPRLWGLAAFLSVPFLVLAGLVRGKTGSLVALCLAGGFSGFLGYRAVAEAFAEGAFGEAIRTELGSGWIAHAIAASFLPLVLTAILVALRRPWLGGAPQARSSLK